MQTRTDFPRRVRTIPTEWITLADGTRLAATIWLPEDADDNPVPAILEYLPYRRRDGTVLRDRQMHAYFAGHGYAAVRVDMRGSGDSDGLLADEYLPQEQADAVEVIAWLAAQPWCSGSVGMMGISWGGFNALQVASHRPPALKAIITACSTDDRYADDCHYMGGCLLNNTIAWASTMFAFGAQPPDPDVVGERWRDMWLERLENNPLMAASWIEHQHARRLLEARLGLRGLFGDHRGRLRGRRLGRRLLQRDPAADRRLARPEERADRAVGACLSARRAARAADRLPARGDPLVGSLAEGHRHRHHGRAGAARLDAGERAAGHHLSGAARPLDRRGIVAAGRSASQAAPPFRPRARGNAG